MTQKGIQRFTSCTRCGTRTMSMRLIAAVLGAVSPRRTSTMTSRRRFMAICFSLAAWFWCTADAFAQARPTSPQPKDAGRPAVAELPSGNPWDTIEWVERRYKIEAMRFKARDETGVDWWGSDEVMVGTMTPKVRLSPTRSVTSIRATPTTSTRLRVASSRCAQGSPCSARRRYASTSASPRRWVFRSNSGRRTCRFPSTVSAQICRAMINISPPLLAIWLR